MGTWGVLPFENDNALDWSWGLDEVGDTSVLMDALEAIADSEELDEDCEEAVAAAEVVAALHGQPLAKLPDEVAAFVKTQSKQPLPTKLRKLASTAVQRIAEDSDLKDRWDETKDAEKWQQAMKDLLERLEE